MTHLLSRGLGRREILKLGTMAAVAAASGVLTAPRIARAAAPYELPPLPYADDALAPTISSQTIGFHYGKHHKGYLDNLNRMVPAGHDLAKLSLEDLVKTTLPNPNRTAIYNSAAMIWNHTFYWESMSPKGGGTPSGKLADAIGAAFGGVDGFRKQFKDAAMGQFGSGWAWLVADKDGKLAIRRTGNADSPMAQGVKCLLTIDVWEHAYYLDYQNRRGDYIDAWLDKVVNWDFAGKNLG